MVPLRSWFTGMRSMALPAAVLQADFVVSMPKLKTHHWAGMTCSMKNLFGVVPGAVYGWPKNLLHVRGIHAVDPGSDGDGPARVSRSSTPSSAMEGDGPIMGRPRPLGFPGDGHGSRRRSMPRARASSASIRRRSSISTRPATTSATPTRRRMISGGEAPKRYRTNFDLIESQAKIRLSA